MNKNRKIVIGSGLSGPLLAILLAQRGYFVDLYEKRCDIRNNSISAGRSINLALSHRGIKALKSAKLFDKIEPKLIPMKGRMVHLLNGKTEYQPYSIYPNEYINSVSRLELNKVLLNKAEKLKNINIYFNHQLDRIDEKNNMLIFNNKQNIPINSHVFGADGAGSTIRKFIDKKVNYPSYSKPLGHGYKELHIPPANDKFQLEHSALHIWPRKGFMLIALPNMDKSFTCTLFLNSKGKTSFESLNSSQKVINFFEKYFKDLLPLLDNFPNIFFENPTGNLSTVYAEEWHYKNKYCLIGDAAHAIVPFFGQGMNASFEDCEVIMQCIDETENWDLLFEKYNKIRKADGHAIANMAIENYLEMRDHVTQKKFIKNKEISNKLWKKFPNRFVPRYNMVSFTSIPYSEVYERGKIQNEIINNINCEDKNFTLAKKQIKLKLNSI